MSACSAARPERSTPCCWNGSRATALVWEGNVGPLKWLPGQYDIVQPDQGVALPGSQVAHPAAGPLGVPRGPQRPTPPGSANTNLVPGGKQK